jgi:hypothetical protein
MDVCAHTRLTVPECSCPACGLAQLRRHAPTLAARSRVRALAYGNVEMLAVREPVEPLRRQGAQAL